jgi:hypothetical protein
MFVQTVEDGSTQKLRKRLEEKTADYEEQRRSYIDMQEKNLT